MTTFHAVKPSRAESDDGCYLQGRERFWSEYGDRYRVFRVGHEGVTNRQTGKHTIFIDYLDLREDRSPVNVGELTTAEVEQIKANILAACAAHGMHAEIGERFRWTTENVNKSATPSISAG